MKTFNRIAAAAGLLLSLTAAVYAQAPPPAKPMTAPMPMAKKMMPIMHRKGGYVKATTYTTKSGKMVHRKGFYRHAMSKPMMTKPMMAKPMPK